MSGIFPLRETVSLGDDREPRLVELDEDVADEVFDALSSRRTRQIFAQLHDSPQAASDLADVTDTSVQNAQYHLEKLTAANLVEVADTWNSERGTEMKMCADRRGAYPLRRPRQGGDAPDAPRTDRGRPGTAAPGECRRRSARRPLCRRLPRGVPEWGRQGRRRNGGPGRTGDARRRRRGDRRQRWRGRER
jgi:DNA-binding transcriptional ArsR family regulator